MVVEMSALQKIIAFLFGTRYVAYCDYNHLNSFQVCRAYQEPNGEWMCVGFLEHHHLKPHEQGHKWFFLN